MSDLNLSGAVWRKSSKSSGNGACVEVAFLGNECVAIRDSKQNGAGPVLAFTSTEWIAFVAGVANEEFGRR